MKRLIPFILILVIFAGFLIPPSRVEAQSITRNADGTCSEVIPGSNNTGGGTRTVPCPAEDGSALTRSINCGLTNIGHCIVWIFYFLFHTIPSFILGLVAQLLNIVIALSLSSEMYGSSLTTFVGEAWKVVRDLSNIFFILILLYIALKTILGLGGHETKKMVGQVIIMALLINFSMFFTKIVIDTSNILALIFYNKIEVKTTVLRTTGEEDLSYLSSLDSNKIGIKDKDISGGLAKAFDVTKITGDDFFNHAKNYTQVGVTRRGSVGGVAGAVGTGAAVGSVIPIIGTGAGALIGGALYGLSFIGSNDVPTGLLLSIIVVAGAIMIFAIKAFLTVSVAFISRLIELWLMIIFAPFAFMSSAAPGLSKISGIGWSEWSKRLIKVAFMAPIFMFFLYLIFKIINTDIVGNIVGTRPEGQSTIEMMILVILPAFIILILLNKATEYAQKASGELGETVMGLAKAGGTLAVGGAFLAGGAVLKGSIGAFAKGAATGESSMQRFSAGTSRGKWDKFQGALGQTLTLGQGTKIQQALGGWLNRDQKKVEDASHARHTFDDYAGKMFQGKKYDDLTSDQREKVKDRTDLDILTRNKTPILLPVFDQNGQPVMQVNGQPQMEFYNYGNKTKFADIGDDAKASLKQYLAAMPTQQREDLEDGSIHMSREAQYRQPVWSSIAQASRTGTYNPANIADLVAKEYAGGFNKFATGVLAATVGIMRSSFKGAGIDVEKSTGNFMKDLKETIESSLKHATIKVDLGKAGEEKKEDGHGGGHH